VNIADQIFAHWQRQEIAVRKGEQWQDIDLDPKTGKLILSAPKDIGEDDEERIAMFKHNASLQAQKYRGHLEQFVGGFQQRHKADVQLIDQMNKEFFDGYEKEDHPTQPLQKQVIEKIPASFRSHPLAKVLAYTVANNAILKGHYDKAMAELNKIKGIK